MLIEELVPETLKLILRQQSRKLLTRSQFYKHVLVDEYQDC